MPPRTYRYRQPLNTPEARGARPRQYSRELTRGMLIERDVQIPTRFGFALYADVFRPAGQTRAPPLLAWTPYGKHDPAPLARIYPDSGVQSGWLSDLTIFEAPDPVFWVAQGYAVITIDIPGVWYAQSPATYLSPEEAEAFYDAIEWAGTQAWSNGKVGLSGVSYLTVMQWHVAALNPPHLAAINPWEGWSDTYREVVRHGGIPDTAFWPYIQVRWGASDHPIEDLWAETAEHPFCDEFWASKAADLEKVQIPAWVVGSWSDHGLHTRGTLEGFRRISSPQKWLEVHGRKKWAHYYDPQSRARQLAFFDHFLKGTRPAPAWAAVEVEIRERCGHARRHSSSQWPLPELSYRKLYLAADAGSLGAERPAVSSCCRYDALAEDAAAIFDLWFEADTDIVGHSRLHLFVSAEAADDLDLFVALEKLDVHGQVVGMTHYAIFENGPLALGWLRISHRKLDPDRSTPYLPVLAHRSESKLAPGEIVEADLEILPSGTHFDAGESLRLRIQGRDVFRAPKPLLYARHEDTVNRGTHCIWTGGETASWLQVPVLSVP
ncbi:MAG TPA: CocE/NonD family hydrolase [Steroidobacteraceae bacterium]|nr:CocE/NonD family hydrolase [Steroidobacteraceae bacterium]